MYKSVTPCPHCVIISIIISQCFSRPTSQTKTRSSKPVFLVSRRLGPSPPRPNTPKFCRLSRGARGRNDLFTCALRLSHTRGSSKSLSPSHLFSLCFYTCYLFIYISYCTSFRFLYHSFSFSRSPPPVQSLSVISLATYLICALST